MSEEIITLDSLKNTENIEKSVSFEVEDEETHLDYKKRLKKN